MSAAPARVAAAAMAGLVIAICVLGVIAALG